MQALQLHQGREATPQPFRRPRAAKTEPPVRQGLSWTTFGVQLLEGPGVAPTGALCRTGQVGSWGCRVVLRPSRLQAAVFLRSPSWYKDLLSCLSGPTWPCGQPSTACRDPFTWVMLLTKTEHSTGTRPLPHCSSLDTGLLLAELIKLLCPPLKDPDSQGKRKMLFKTSLLCCARLCAAPQQCCAPSRAEMSMAPHLCVHKDTCQHTRTLLRSSSTCQIASHNLSHTINGAVAAHTPLGSSAASEPCVLSVRSA